MAQWMALYSGGGFANDTAASATVGTVISCQGWAAWSGRVKQDRRTNRDRFFILNYLLYL
jgi:hypothetical protein